MAKAKKTSQVVAEEQFEDKCSILTHFEYHPEKGVCMDSAKEIVMNVGNASSD